MARRLPQNDSLAGIQYQSLRAVDHEKPAGSDVIPAGSSSSIPSDGYCAQVWPPATMTGPELLSVVLSPTWPNSLYPQQRPTPSWFTPQV